MHSARWERLKILFAEALDRPPDAREAFARQACGADQELAADVLRLLDGHDRARRSLSNPILPHALEPAGEKPPRFVPPLVAAGRFRILRLIARGGMGEVYEAEDLQLGVRVALKTVREDIAGNERALEMFRNEIQIARRVTHPNVCRIYDIAQHSEPTPGGGEVTTFLTMELLAGETLSDRFERKGPFSQEQALPLIGQIVSALDAAHKADVIHRDLKPGNVMLVPGPEGELRAVVTDFGLAIPRADAASPPLAAAAGGTPGYMAPEQIQGGEITTATDVYALALVIAEMIGASVQPAGASLMRTLLHRKSPGGGVKLTIPAWARRWEPVLCRCLDEDARKRYSRPLDVLEALETANGRGRLFMRPTLFATAVALLAVVLWLTASVAQRYSSWHPAHPMTFRRIGPDDGLTTLWRPSPDGRFFAISDWRTGRIALRDIATGEIRALAKSGDAPQAAAVTAAFSPDGTRIAYAAQYAPEHTRGCDVRAIDTRTGEDVLLYGDPATKDCEVFDWSRDGSRVLSRFYGKGETGLAVVSVADHSVVFPELNGLESYGNMVFSPDGTRVVFSARRSQAEVEADIFEIPIQGGPVTPVVTHPANDNIIGFSPEGRRLIFSSDRKGANGVWALAFSEQGASGEPEELAHDIGRSEPLGLTNDGSLYYLLATDSQDVYTAEIDVAAARRLSGPDSVVKRFNGFFMFPSWSPDGRRLSLWWRLDPQHPTLGIYSLDTGRIRTVQPKLRQFLRPQWDPSGDNIYVQGKDNEGRGGIFRVDPDTGDATLVVSHALLRSGYEGAWSCDGRTIFNRFDDARLGIFRVDIDTGRRQVLFVPAPGVDLDVENLALSPDERTLAFQARQPAAGASSLLLMPARGGPARPLLTVHQPEVFPFGAFAWTADSSQILTLRSREHKSEIWLVPVYGGEPRKIDFPPMRIVQLHMSPDGRTVAFTAGGRSQEIWVAENLLPSTAR